MSPGVVLFIGLLHVAASVIKYLQNMMHAIPYRCQEQFLLEHGSLVLHEQHTRLKFRAGAAMEPTGKSTGSGVLVVWLARQPNGTHTRWHLVLADQVLVRPSI